MGLLEGRRAVVTGAGSGIGRSTALRMAAEGAAVAVLDIDAATAAAVAAEITALGCPPALAVEADVADSASLGAGFDRAAEALGGLDTVCNNAGIGAVLPLDRYSDDLWAKLIGVNLGGVFNGIRAALPHLRAAGGGVIVNMSSVDGIRPARGEGPYSAAKAGVIALTRSAALEYGPTIRVNCISPGFIDTPLTALGLSAVPGARAAIDAATPLGRAGTAREVADVVVFLCSDLSSYVTGVNLAVDGGSLLPNPQVDPLLHGILGMLG
jgi:NAD(P)-dependent dehydrogenase (short-subunit alcohol dehydrogenase family)